MCSKLGFVILHPCPHFPDNSTYLFLGEPSFHSVQGDLWPAPQSNEFPMTWLDFESLLCWQSSTDMLSRWMELCCNSLEAACGHQGRGRPEEHAQSWGWSAGCSQAFQHSWIQQEPMIPPILPQTSLCLVLGFTNAKYPDILNRQCKSLSSGRLCKNRYKGALAGLGHCSNAGTSVGSCTSEAFCCLQYDGEASPPGSGLPTGCTSPHPFLPPTHTQPQSTHTRRWPLWWLPRTHSLHCLRPPEILFHSNNCSLTLQSPI